MTVGSISAIATLGLSVGEVFYLVAIGITAILAIVGITQQKVWAKWMVVAVYSLYIFRLIEGLINSFVLGAAF